MLAVGQRHGALHDRSGCSRLSKWERRVAGTTDEVGGPGQSRAQSYRGRSKPRRQVPSREGPAGVSLSRLLEEGGRRKSNCFGQGGRELEHLGQHPRL